MRTINWLVIGGLAGAVYFALPSGRSSACVIAWSNESSLEALSAGCGGGDVSSEYAADSFACYPYYNQDCESPYGEVESQPEVYSHYHLIYTDPVSCFGTGSEYGWFGEEESGTCDVYTPWLESRLLTAHDTDEIITVFPKNGDDFVNFQLGIDITSPGTAEVCLYADVVPSGYSVGWYCWGGLYQAYWEWTEGFSGFRWSDIDLETDNTSEGPPTFGDLVFSES